MINLARVTPCRDANRSIPGAAVSNAGNGEGTAASGAGRNIAAASQPAKIAAKAAIAKRSFGIAPHGFREHNRPVVGGSPDFR